MGILWWLAQEFWPYALIAFAVIGSWLGLKAKAASDRQLGRNEAMREQEIKGAQTRREVEEDLARTPDAARTDELQRWER